ncbi:MAG: FAD-dependent monooxygenase [Betaproteobacteria bacterium]
MRDATASVTQDVVIVGAGPVGAALALALRDADLDLVVVDARVQGQTPRGDRSLALSHGARLILERLGVWTPLNATPGAVTAITAIDISQARGFGSVRLDASEQGLPALGYVVSYRALQQTFDDALRAAAIDVRFGMEVRTVTPATDAASIDTEGTSGQTTLRTRLAVVADGSASMVRGIDRRRHDYRQTAVVASVALDHPHGGVAYERFTSDGPVALLPERDRYGLVWTQKPDEAARTLALSDAAFVSELAAHFGSRLRGFTGVRDRRSFPLALERARDTTVPHVVVIGNAAQALHPVAGQGFNLGLRDAFELAAVMVDSPREDLGNRAMLVRYARRRTRDRRAGIAFTHGLVHVFGNDQAFFRVPRGVGMTLLDSMPFAKRAFTHAMLFGMR